ncbi:hypothetical protein BG011_007521 [Mortierella polycephala]|uniref:Uncharacterized protein n=1 Tax=Mortierella polycephala TaxID=41804 RepID=A0A9P6PQX1_9FUNG|nr:hypothetical protein BG011_007521 [Mortierella polycephala]
MKPLLYATFKGAKRSMIDTRETARRLGISLASASWIYSDCKENMSFNKRRYPRKILAGTVEYFKVNMIHGTLRTAVEDRNTANRILLDAMSVSAIRRRGLKEAGSKAKRRVKRPALKKRAH